MSLSTTKSVKFSDSHEIFEFEENDKKLELNMNHWREIQKYASIKWMNMNSLKEKYGSEWVENCVVDFDDIYIEVIKCFDNLFQLEYCSRIYILILKNSEKIL